MSTRVVRLPSPSRSYLAVRKTGHLWCLDLMTPWEGGKPLRTKLVSGSLEAVVERGRADAERMQRPLRPPRGIEA